MPKIMRATAKAKGSKLSAMGPISKDVCRYGGSFEEVPGYDAVRLAMEQVSMMKASGGSVYI